MNMVFPVNEETGFEEIKAYLLEHILEIPGQAFSAGHAGYSKLSSCRVEAPFLLTLYSNAHQVIINYICMQEYNFE
ncbi:hypothetical protein KSC_086000 [Ktedonobacter sp. SOSP1-52]|nr:hypothetical protein KSC_086000 [Ktedonobacter sp. SOSP1-52]